MKKKTAIVVMTLGVVLTMSAYAIMAMADARTEAIVPQMGMMRSGQNVMVVNPDPVSIDTYGSALGTVKLTYGEKCYMFTGAPFVAIGVDGQRVLVRSRVRGPHQLYDEGRPVCSGDVLFWVGYQEYLLSAEAYDKAQLEKRARENADDRDRRVIRLLLDQQLARK
jgi:hypothetical protein